MEHSLGPAPGRDLQPPMMGIHLSSKRCNLPRESPLPTLNFTGDGHLEHTPVTPPYKGTFTGFNVIIEAKGDMTSLYTKGYFGKGSLSHSYPSYRKRLQRILEADQRGQQSNVNAIRTSETLDPTSQTTELACGRSDGIVDDSECADESLKEELHLTLEEAFFLSYALNCLQIFNGDEPLDPDTAWSTFGAVQTNFIERYVTYHHFRSKGWVIRSGVKYGADYVLYKDGPPFYHATYVVFISNDQTDVSFYLTCYRAVEVTKKELLLCRVNIPEKISLDRLKECQVSEYTLKRWLPAENRNTKAKS